jgi:anthranilate synthase component 2
MIAVIDNYDSFTWNLVQYLRELGANVEVFRNDQVTVDELVAMSPAGLLLSPGPGTPDDAGITLAAVKRFSGHIPVFGVCLGHQAIGQHFGGLVSLAGHVMHGKRSLVHHNGEGVFAGLPTPFNATRYHSLVVASQSLPNCLCVTSWTLNDQGHREEIMGFRHLELDVEGVQFHPESIESEHGHALLKSFLDRCLAAQ